MTTFTVLGRARPAGSKRGFIYQPKGGGKPRVAMTDMSGHEGRRWRTAVAEDAAICHGGREPLEGPLVLHVAFYFDHPKAHRRADGTVKLSAPAYPATRPDVTKLLRAVEDACTGILWRDDAQIVRQTAVKAYLSQLGPRCVISYGPVSDPPEPEPTPG